MKSMSYEQVLLTFFLDGETIIYSGEVESLNVDDAIGTMSEISMLDNKESIEFLKSIDFKKEYIISLVDRIVMSNDKLFKMLINNIQ